MKFELNQEQLNIIVELLNNAPFRIAAPIMNELSRQMQEQQQQAQMRQTLFERRQQMVDGMIKPEVLPGERPQ